MNEKVRFARVRALFSKLKSEEKPIAEEYLSDYEIMTAEDRAPLTERLRDREAELYLTARGREAIPDYLPEDYKSVPAAAEALKNFTRVRELFAENAGNPNGEDRHLAGRMWLEAADLAYRGSYDAGETVTVPFGSGFLREQNRLSLRKFSDADLPKDLRGSYDESSGIFDCQGLRAFLAFRGTTVVVAFSGTVFDTKMIEADVAQAFAASWVYLWAAGLVGDLLSRYPDAPFVLCGHSLGGGLAQFALAANCKGGRDITAYCYNAAGLNYVAYQTLANAEVLECARTRVEHFVVEGEPISAFFGLIGHIATYPAPRGFNLYQRHRIATVRMSMDGAIG